VTTECAEPLKVLTFADSGNALGRPNSFGLSAVDAEGNSLETIDAENDQGGGEGFVDFGRGKPFERHLAVASWLKFPAAGRYELTVKRDLPVGTGRRDLDWLALTVSTPIEIVRRGAVIFRTPASRRSRRRTCRPSPSTRARSPAGRT
jgi:hypothetical protein